ncbi:MAG: hybrid sensor histidine kinase/response regulator, partial [Cyanobacteria bacterium P01_A01_bin.114]
SPFPLPMSPPSLNDPDRLVFADEADENQAQSSERLSAWKIMLVDDEPSVHQATRVALKFFTFEDRPLSFVSAYSAVEAKQLIEAHPDTALVLLDVIMESQDAGLQVAKYIREDLQNQTVRIVLRTGQPGQVPEESVVIDYDINDYKTKLELTQQKLFTTLVASLRAYRDLRALEQSQAALADLNAELQNFNQNLEQIVRDRTQQLEHEVENCEKAETALKIYIHALSHDLRNPVTGMTHVLQSLINRSRRQKDSTTAQIPISILERMNAGCDRQLKMIGSLLETQEIEIWGVALQRAPFQLSALVQAVIEDWQPRFDKKRVTVVQQMASNLPALNGDRYQLWRVFENLIDNALKYNPPGITLRLGAALTAADWLCCTVADNGVGIDTAQINITQSEALFGLYSRGGSPTQGLGLGLYICRRIIEAHGGKIGMTHPPGNGVEFWFTLPTRSESSL